VVGAGAFQLETLVQRTMNSRGTRINPACNPFSSIELSVGGEHVRGDGHESLTLQHWQVKQLMRAPEESKTGFALASGGQRERRGLAREIFLNGIATPPSAGRTQWLHLNLGVLDAKDDLLRRTRAPRALAYHTEVGSRTWASLEGLGSAGQRASLQLSLRHELLPGRVQLDARVGSAVGRWWASRIATVGLVVVIPGPPALSAHRPKFIEGERT
jgi:hypothetical protein